MRENVDSSPQWIELKRWVDWESGFVACGMWQQKVGDATITDPELYSFERLNAELAADPALRDKARALGVTTVASCAEARAVNKSRAELRSLYAVEVAEDEPPNDSPPPSGSRVDKIGSGSPFNHPPTVLLTIWSGDNYAFCNHCSGSLIGPNTILTAAHCAVADNSRPMSVKAWDGTCIHGDCSNGGCSVKPAKNARTFLHPSYTGGADPADDIAVVRMFANHPSPSNTSASWIRLSSSPLGPGMRYWMTGWGMNSESGSGFGVLRLSNTAVANETLSLAYLEHETVHGQGTVCHGDSGGPAISTEFGVDLVAGVTAVYYGNNDNCAQSGDRFRHTQAGPKIAWLESKIGACNHFSAAGGWPYVRCW